MNFKYIRGTFESFEEKKPSHSRDFSRELDDYIFIFMLHLSVAMEVMPDYIHLLLDCKPQFMISDMIKILKGSIARRLFLDYPELKKQLWGGHLWNPSYCAVTVSERSNEQVAHYIHTQKQ